MATKVLYFRSVKVYSIKEFLFKYFAFIVKDKLLKCGNIAVLGKCPPGWMREEERCYKYMGAALPYHEANQFCQVNKLPGLTIGVT